VISVQDIVLSLESLQIRRNHNWLKSLSFFFSQALRTYPRRITIADPVPGIAQPRLADTSAFLTCRHPPSR
jgi:hypothetical protein